MLRPFVPPEIAVPRTCRDHEKIEREPSLVEDDARVVDRDVADLGQKHLKVGLGPQQAADRRRDRRRRQTGGRDLIEQRLEHMMVVAVDKGHAAWRAGEATRGSYAAEAAAEDDDVRRA